MDDDGPLLVIETEEGPQRVVLGRSTKMIGRDRGADVQLSDRSLSTQHCRIEPAGDGHKVVDLDSRNGTFVNGAAVSQRKLADGDRIRLGRVEMRYLQSSVAEDLFSDLTRVVSRVHRKLGEEGMLEAANRFSEAASRRGHTGLLVRSEDADAVARLPQVLRSMVEAREPQRVYELIVDAMIELTGAERGFVILHEMQGTGKRAKRARRVVAARNFDGEEVRDAAAKVSRTIERDVLKSSEPVLVTDAAIDERFSTSASVVDMRLRSILAVPVPGRDGPIGIIVLDNRFERGVFVERQIPIIRLFADQAAVALENASLHAENEHRMTELVAAKLEVEELNRILEERVAQTNAELMEVREQVLRERDQAPLKYSYANIIGDSRPMRDVFHLLDKVTDSDVPVLIHGESGTGKELVARAIHFNGARKNGPFISENCAAIPDTLLESELFGYTKGSFTGATADRKGLFEAANGGTLFLDEIGDMPMDMQKKLLRVLQEREVRRVGGTRTIAIDVRILAASNQDLRKLCDEGRFREDLYYRLNVITVNLPPLRDRRDDIPLLVSHFLHEATTDPDGEPRAISDEAMHALKVYPWPGNVRELRNEVLRAAALSDKVIVPMILSANVRGGPREPAEVAELGKRTLKEMVREVTEGLERGVIQAALDRSEGKKAQAARLLGISRPTLDSKIEAYGLIVKRKLSARARSNARRKPS